MQHLNYCRQMTKSFQELIPTLADTPRMNALAERMNFVMGLARESQKFLLPNGGMILDDLEFRGLDGLDQINLPFPLVAIEYQMTEDKITREDDGKPVGAYKRVIFAQQRKDGGIAICPVFYNEIVKRWIVLPFVALPGGESPVLERKGGLAKFAFHQIDGEDYSEIDFADYSDEVGTLLGLLNALACSNVHIARSESGVRKAMSKKGSLPFDAYNVLHVDIGSVRSSTDGARADHRSPREHLRRGHIRRLPSGSRIWVNAAVINAGVGGKVSKDYAVRAA